MSIKIERLMRIYNRLRRGPVTIDVISAWAKSAGIQVSERQLYRDLNTLTQLRISEVENVYEYTDEKNRKVWKLEYDDSNTITQYDLNSFFLFRNFIPFSIHTYRQDSFEKLEQILYKALSRNKYQQYVEANEKFLNRSNFMENMYGAEEHSMLEDLIWAVQNRRVIVIENDDLNSANIHFFGNPFPLNVRPLELLFHRGRVYVCGLTEKENRYVAFAINKTLRYQLTNESFDHQKYWQAYQKNFDRIFGISDPVDEQVYHVKIEFTSKLGESFKDFYWHHSQQWKKLRNGNYMLHLQCSLGRELVGFVAQALDKVKVHQPVALKNLVIKKLGMTLDLYQHDMTVDEESANREY